MMDSQYGASDPMAKDTNQNWKAATDCTALGWCRFEAANELWRSPLSGVGPAISPGNAQHVVELVWLPGGEPLSFAPDGSTLALAYEQGFYSWHLPTLKRLRTVRCDCRIVKLAYSPDGRAIVVVSEDSRLALWSTIDGSLVWQTVIPREDRPVQLGFTPCGSAIYGTGFGRVSWYSSESGECMRRWSAPNTCTYVWGLGSVPNFRVPAALSPDGETIALLGVDAQLYLWRTANGALARSLPEMGPRYWVKANELCFSPDGRRIAACMDSGQIRLLTVSPVPGLLVLDGHSTWATSAAFTPDGRILATGAGDRTVRLWRVSDGALLATFPLPRPEYVYSLAFSPDGQVLTAGLNGYSVRLWGIPISPRRDWSHVASSGA